MYREDSYMKISKKLLVPLLALGVLFASSTTHPAQAADRYVTTYSDGESIWITNISNNPSVDTYKVSLKYVKLTGRYETDTIYFKENNNKWFYNNGNGWYRVQPNTSMNDILYYILNN
jgi:hypothetical protein